MRALFATGLALFLTSCASVLGIGDLPPATDQDSGPAEAGMDAIAPDVGTNDAKPDAPTTWCTTQQPAHAFCADFDVGNFFDAFTKVLTSSNGALADETKQVRSQPNALMSTLPPTNFNGDYAYLTYVGPSSVTHVTYAFDFWLDALVHQAGALATIATIVIDASTPNEHAITYDVSYNGNDELGQRWGNSANETGTSYMSTPTQWQRISIDVDLKLQTVSVMVGGLFQSNVALDPSWQKSGSLTLSLGFSRVTYETESWTGYFDNVTADWQ